MAEKYKNFQRTQLSTIQIKHRKNIWYRQKRIEKKHFLLISVHADMATTKRNTIEQRMSNSSPFVVISLLEQNSKRFSKSAI